MACRGMLSIITEHYALSAINKSDLVLDENEEEYRVTWILLWTLFNVLLCHPLWHHGNTTFIATLTGRRLSQHQPQQHLDDNKESEMFII